MNFPKAEVVVAKLGNCPPNSSKVVYYSYLKRFCSLSLTTQSKCWNNADETW